MRDANPLSMNTTTGDDSLQYFELDIYINLYYKLRIYNDRYNHGYHANNYPVAASLSYLNTGDTGEFRSTRRKN